VRGANGRRVSRGRFRVVGCGAFRLDFDGGLGGEAEETALFLPVMRQVFAQSQQPARRQRVGLTAREERAHDFRAEIGQPNKRSEPALIHSEASAHCLDAVVRS
jgi:hypothetical protein